MAHLNSKNEYEEKIAITDGVDTKKLKTEFVTWNDPDITN